MNRAVVFSLLALGAACASASARPMFHYEFPIEGLQETPPNASPGSGWGIVDLDTDMNVLSWTITYSGLLAPVTAAHFHEAPPGVPGGVKLDIGAISGGLGSPMVGSSPITEAHEAAILGGLWYVNIHTSVFPGGEIRGQVVPTPGSLALLGVGGLVALRRRR